MYATFGGDNNYPAATSASYNMVMTDVGLPPPADHFSFAKGFASADGQISFAGNAKIDGSHLQLTDGGHNEAGSSFYATSVNIQSFISAFDFQIINPFADGITFTIQNAGVTALGGTGGYLGYSGIKKSVAIKFDLHNNDGEGTNSTGIYTDGAPATVPSIDLAGTGIDLHSGHPFKCHLTYDGTNLTLTMTDTATRASWSHAFPVNIPAIIGGEKAYVGFTGGSGGLTAEQTVISWTYTSGQPATPSYAGRFEATGLVLNGSTVLEGSRLQLTDGGRNETGSAFLATPVNIQSFTNDFAFQILNPWADGFTFTIQTQA